MFLEDHAIDLPDPLHAMTRGWTGHRSVDHSVRLSLGTALASPGGVCQSDDHPEHAPIEARGGCARLPRATFS